MVRIIIMLVAIVVLLVSSVAADYQLSVTLLSYSNPENKCAACRDSPLEPFGCCDNHLVKDAAECRRLKTRQCEIVVSMCLRQPSGRIDTALCPIEDLLGVITSDGTYIWQTNPHIFKPTQVFTSTWETWNTSKSQLYITLMDADDFGRPMETFELVDSFPLNLTIGERFNRTTLTGQFELATVELELSLACTDNYYGPDCSHFCAPHSCTCDPGFTGEFCQTNINECNRVDCSGRGVCIDGVNSYTCQCEDRYSGSNCQVDIVGAVIGALAGGCVLLMLLIIALLAFLVQAKKKRKDFDKVDLTQQLNAPFLENEYEITAAEL